MRLGIVLVTSSVVAASLDCKLASSFAVCWLPTPRSMSLIACVPD
ncbi:hypothetical protein R3I93_006080 [Phoxinus phoxinus]|uniref:Uncharacterized protein n=1 Tax=Phoxinus phoxinus TaxID=58324 RepID=A0AAN9D852_9TELE